MKKIVTILIICYSSVVLGQSKHIPVKFYLDDTLQCIESDLKFEFRTLKDTCIVGVKCGKIQIPDLCYRFKYVDMIVTFKNKRAVISRVPVKENLTYDEQVLWKVGFDNYPFNMNVVKNTLINEDVKQIFYWQIDYDEIEDLLVVPIVEY